MNTAILTEPRIVTVNVTDEAIVAHLADGRVVSVPLEWSWRLKGATPEERANWELIGYGLGVHWPDVDEDISVEGMLRGVPARQPVSRPQNRGTKAKSARPAHHRGHSKTSINGLSDIHQRRTPA